MSCFPPTEQEPLEEFFDALQEDVERATLETCQSSGSTFVTPVLRPRPGTCPLPSAPSILGSFSRNSSCSSVYHDALSEWELEALDAPVKAQLAHPLGWGRVVQPVILCKDCLRHCGQVGLVSAPCACARRLSFLSMGFCLCHGDWHRGQREAERLPLLLIACFLGAFTASFLSPRLQQLAATAATALLGLRRSQSRRPYALLLDWACAGVAVSSVLSAAAAAPLRRPGWLGFQLALGISAALWGLQLATALPPTALPAATLLSIFLHLIAQLCLQGGCGPIIHVAPMDSLAEKAEQRRLCVAVRGAKPGLMTNLFVGACLLIGALSSLVPPMPTPSVPNLTQMPENDPNGLDDCLLEFHMQAGLVDKTWMQFDSGACTNCCPEWFAPDYPVLPLNESAPSLRSLCVHWHSGILFPLVSVARLLLQDFWTVMAKDYMALIDPTGNVGIEEDLGALESDVHDCSIDLCQIGALIAAAQGMKASDDSRWDTWEVPETELKLIRHVKVWRNEMPGDDKDWRGRVEFGLTHKPQRKHSQKSAPRPHDPQIGKPPPQKTNGVVEMESETVSKSRAKNDVEPDELGRQVRVSRNVEEHELENTLRAVPMHNEKMKELLMKLFKSRGS
eukprot:s373_g5.t2